MTVVLRNLECAPGHIHANGDGLKRLFPRLLRVPSENADVSVVVTVKNDPRVIECAEQVLAQRTSFRFDLVVVDNGSTDETAPRLSIRFDGDRRVTLLSSGGNLSESWNHGAKAASGRVLVRIDADAIPLPGWLEALAAPLLLGDADWTAGPVGGVSPQSTIRKRSPNSRRRKLGTAPVSTRWRSNMAFV